MNSNVLNKLRQRKRRILKRIENRPGPESESPMITASNIQYELADRVGGLACGGIGAMLLLQGDCTLNHVPSSTFWR